MGTRTPDNNKPDWTKTGLYEIRFYSRDIIILVENTRFTFEADPSKLLNITVCYRPGGKESYITDIKIIAFNNESGENP